MISQSLSFLSGFLNKKLKRIFGLEHDLVITGNLVEPDGRGSENVQNKIVITVVNIEHETVMKSPASRTSGGGDTFGKVAPPVHLNLFLMISANYNSKNYLEGLKMLSAVITALQSNPFFTKQSNPEMEDPLEKLIFEIYNLPPNELSHIWSGIGAKYLPSVLYKMRMITISDDNLKKGTPSITGLGDSTNSK